MVSQLLNDPVNAHWASSLIPRDAGKSRELYTQDVIWGLTSDFGMYRPSIQNVYSLWLYLYRTGDTLAIQPHYNTIRSFYNGKIGASIDPGNLYGTMGAHVGMARLAHAFNDQAQVAAAAANLQRYLALGLDIHYADSMAFYGLQGRNAPFAEAYEERKDNWVVRGHIFLNLGPEIGRYLRDHLHQEVAMRHTQAMRMFPFWWLRQSPYFTRWTGDEGIGIPSEIFGMFVPVERWVMDSDAKTLAAYMLSAPLGLADSYWLEALVLAIEAKAYDLWVNVRDTPFSLDIVAEDEIVALPDMTVVQGSNICFSAAHTITVGGNSINFIVEAGTSVRLEAANTIRMLEGTTIQGYLLARIVTGGTFCYPEPMMLAADQGENFPLFTESSE